ncbi:MAG: phosphoribosylaminoimidazolesuccinocarboxamide synthase [Candidatus Kapabacteria bacterium]|nr:phosphoribosylaminoimidazolesuccinocarboxamide synthase [Candidatus Kapabacteria bacterium]
MNALYSTDFSDLTIFRRGKVRDVYDMGDSLLIVASDRISAFDVIMNEPVPGKGALLTDVSLFWFGKISSLIAHHVISTDVDTYPESLRKYSDILRGRSMLARKTQPLPVECVVRGYLAGSGWKEYNQNQTVCGVQLPAGLVESSQLPEPIFTPATKAEEGHDENISFEQTVEILGEETAAFVRDMSIKIYTMARDFAATKGIILADTKFEFGRLPDGSIIIIDEALTPDSSRYWLASEYEPGKPQMNFDKQVLRDWLEAQDWNKQPPPPTLPDSVIEQTLAKYKEAHDRLLA